MKGDFSRLTFDPQHRYSRVVSQQGRVQLDADWNEQADIIAHRIEIETRDLVGTFGVPKRDPGFGILARYGLHFDGEDDFVYLGRTHHLDFSEHSPFTIEAWIAPQAAGTIVSKFHTYRSGIRHGEYRLAILPDGTLLFERGEVPEKFDKKTDKEIDKEIDKQIDKQINYDSFSNASGEPDHPDARIKDRTDIIVRQVRTHRTVPFGEFSHVAVTYTGTEIRLFLNGHLAAYTYDDRPGYHVDRPVLIGATGLHEDHGPYEDFFAGNIEKVRFWRTARTSTEILNDIYHYLPSDDVVAYWPLDDGIGDTANNLIPHSPKGFLGNDQMNARPQWCPGELMVSRGRCYIEGVLCEKHHETKLDFPHHIGPGVGYVPAQLVYLDVWNTYVSALTDPNIREVALGGPDTTGRVRTDFHVGCVPLDRAPELQTMHQQQTLSHGALKASRNTVGMLDNHMYRVEIHSSGACFGNDPRTEHSSDLRVRSLDKSHAVVPDAPLDWQPGDFLEFYEREGIAHGHLAQITAVARNETAFSVEFYPIEAPASRSPGHTTRTPPHLWEDETHTGIRVRKVASFKWSRENASIQFAIDSIDDNTCFITTSNADTEALAIGTWIEIVDAESLALHKPGKILRIENVDLSNQPVIEIKLGGSPDRLEFLRKGNSYTAGSYYLVCWSQNVDDTLTGQFGLLPVQKRSVEIELGIEVEFATGSYRAGDYWQFVSRNATQNITWPQGGETSLSCPPHGVYHHYANLAVVTFDSDRPAIQDLRPLFGTLEQIAAARAVPPRSREIEVDIEVSDGHTRKLVPIEVSSPDSLQIELIEPRDQDRDWHWLPAGCALIGVLEEVPEGYRPPRTSLTLPISAPHWDLEGELPMKEELQVVATEDHIYILGESGRMWRFAPHSQSLDFDRRWDRTLDLPGGKRHGFACCALNGMVYVVGGTTADGTITSRVDVYDPGSKQWASCAELPVGRTHIGLAAMHGKLYAIGGKAHRFLGRILVASSRCDIYDPDTDTWKPGARLHQGRFDAAVVAAHGHLYLLGGHSSPWYRLFRPVPVAGCHRYSAMARKWQQIAPLPDRCGRVEVTAIEDQVYVFGGKKSEAHVKVGLHLLPHTGHWQPGMVTDPDWHQMSICSSRGTLYFLGHDQSAHPNHKIRSCQLFTRINVYLANSE